VKRFGVRLMFMLGSLVAAGLHIAASFSPNIYVLFVTNALLGGIAIGICYLACLTALSQYFDERKCLVISVFLSGMGIGMAFWPPLSTILFAEYGWRGAFWILAGFHLQGCVSGALMRPFIEDTENMPTINKTVSSSTCVSQFKILQAPYLAPHLGLALIALFPFVFVPAYLPTMAIQRSIRLTEAASLVSVYGKMCLQIFTLNIKG
jgi:MFS family permease